MGNLTENKQISREIVDYNWGKVVTLYQTDCYVVKEYTIKPSCSVMFKREFSNCFLIITSGTSEITLESEKIKLFKSEKFNFKGKEVNIQNCGVIPLVLIETVLK